MDDRFEDNLDYDYDYEWTSAEMVDVACDVNEMPGVRCLTGDDRMAFAETLLDIRKLPETPEGV